MGLMSLELEALLVIEVLISCENWFPSFGGGSYTDWGHNAAWKSKIRAKWTENNLLYQKKGQKIPIRGFMGVRKETLKESKNKNMLSHSPLWNVRLAFGVGSLVLLWRFSLCQAFHLIMSTLQSATAWLMLHFHEGNFNSTSSALNAHPIMRLSW